MPVLAFSPNADLSKGFPVAQVAQKDGWPEPMVWSHGLFAVMVNAVFCLFTAGSVSSMGRVIKSSGEFLMPLT